MTGCVSEEPTHCQGTNRPTLCYPTLNQLYTIPLTAQEPQQWADLLVKSSLQPRTPLHYLTLPHPLPTIHHTSNRTEPQQWADLLVKSSPLPRTPLHYPMLPHPLPTIHHTSNRTGPQQWADLLVKSSPQPRTPLHYPMLPHLCQLFPIPLTAQRTPTTG